MKAVKLILAIALSGIASATKFVPRHRSASIVLRWVAARPRPADTDPRTRFAPPLLSHLSLARAAQTESGWV
jgi:hypothetical protein